ncbi:unnamed protein product, partial [Phaeothamnion confervicola]
TPWALAVLSGFLLFVAYPPRGFEWPAWIALVPLLWASRSVAPRQAFWMGWLTGFLTNMGAFWFVYELIVTYSAIPAPVAFLIMLIMGLQQGLWIGLWLGLARHLENRVPRWLLYPTLWVGLEWIYPTVFPVYLGNCQNGCLWSTQLMDLAGPSGLSFVVLSFNLALASLLPPTSQRSWRKTESWLGPLLLGLTLIYGEVRIHQVLAQMEAAPKIKIAMVENHIGLVHSPFDLTEGTRLMQTMAAEAVRTSQPDLIVFPETSMRTPPPPFRSEGDVVHTELQRYYPANPTAFDTRSALSPQMGYHAPLIFGTISEEETLEGPIPGRKAKHNAAFLLDADGNVLGKGAKFKLLIGGEYIPGAAYFPWIYTKYLTRASSHTPAPDLSVWSFLGHRLGLTICYEDILPELSYKIAQKDPNLLVNLTNDAWFGKTVEPAAHLVLARARAIELRRYMARSTTTGISCFIDPLGRIVSQTQGDAPQTLVGEVGWMEGKTVFADLGPVFPWLCLLF